MKLYVVLYEEGCGAPGFIGVYTDLKEAQIAQKDVDWIEVIDTDNLMVNEEKKVLTGDV